VPPVSRRAQIRMSDDEALSFLRDERTVICATNGRNGWPHLMPLWYVLRETGPGGAPELWAWTFAKSQKVRNLERDARATLQVEAGEEYHLLRGVMLVCETKVHHDTPTVAELGLEIFGRYVGDAQGHVGEGVRAMVEAQAPKRVALQFVERARATWDHRKLGGVY
jgi:general stress protein 26